MDSVQLSELAKFLDEAAERGAKRALESIGLHDETAGKDIHDLRDLIDGWRVTKKAFGQAVVHWATIGILGIITGILYLKFSGNGK